jgi:hypothetical protein
MIIECPIQRMTSLSLVEASLASPLRWKSLEDFRAFASCCWRKKAA